MTSTEIPDLTKLFHQMSMNDSKHKALYAETIMRLESLKKQSDPIAMAHARQISFVRIAAEIKENLDLLQEECDRSKSILLKYNSNSSASSNASSYASSSSASYSEEFNEYVQNMDQSIELINNIIQRFNESQQVILYEQLRINEIQAVFTKLYKELYEGDDFESNVPMYKSMLDNLCDELTKSQENLITLGIKLFPPITSKGGKKKAT